MSLNIGDEIPGFMTIKDDGSVCKAGTVLSKKAFVLYFYPKNFTPGRAKEACDFRDSYEDFLSIGAEVIGVSSDSVDSHQKFKTRDKLPFTFSSHKKGKLRKLFGVKSGLLGVLPGRDTYAIDKSGIIWMKFNSINSSKHYKKTIETVKKTG